MPEERAGERCAKEGVALELAAVWEETLLKSMRLVKSIWGRGLNAGEEAWEPEPEREWKGLESVREW